MAHVNLQHVSKVYESGVLAVKEANLSVESREFLVIVGPSGCGKSTLLRMVAGLEEVTSGEVRIGGRIVNHIPPKDRDIAMVFQNHALYP
ncbi:MAG: ATP-binding cassette domain-containing protein, partial [Candidatus Omnitrophica bacterium]|nr:ATP-binding cassette domain-containing protein [Candidatus Omnitrophota bacterium]